MKLREVMLLDQYHTTKQESWDLCANIFNSREGSHIQDTSMGRVRIIYFPRITLVANWGRDQPFVFTSSIKQAVSTAEPNKAPT